MRERQSLLCFLAAFAVTSTAVARAEALEIRDRDFVIDVNSPEGSVCRAFPTSAAQTSDCGIDTAKLEARATAGASSNVHLVAVVLVREGRESYLVLVLRDGRHRREFDAPASWDYARAVRAAAYETLVDPGHFATIDLLGPTEQHWNGIQVLGIEVAPRRDVEASPLAPPHSLYFAAATSRGIYGMTFVAVSSTRGHENGLNALAGRTLATLRATPAEKPGSHGVAHWLPSMGLYLALIIVVLVLLVVVISRRRLLPSRKPDGSAPPNPAASTRPGTRVPPRSGWIPRGISMRD